MGTGKLHNLEVVDDVEQRVGHRFDVDRFGLGAEQGFPSIGRAMVEGGHRCAERRQMVVREGDSSWASNWEKISIARGKPKHIPGWNAGDRGSVLEEPDYMKLAGPWIDGKPPEAQ